MCVEPIRAMCFSSFHLSPSILSRRDVEPSQSLHLATVPLLPIKLLLSLISPLTFSLSLCHTSPTPHVPSPKLVHSLLSQISPYLLFVFLAFNSMHSLSLSFSFWSLPLLASLLSLFLSGSLPPLDLSFSQVGRGNAVPLSRAKVWQRRESGCASAAGFVVGTVGKFSCRRLCQWQRCSSTSRIIRPETLRDFLLSRSESVHRFTVHAKKKNEEEEKKRYH